MEVLAFSDQTVCATVRKPIQLANRFRRNHNTIMYALMTVVIVGATACADIKEFVGQAGVQKFFSVLILEFNEAALTTPITQRFPFLAIEFIKGLIAPKLLCSFVHHDIQIAIVMELPENLI